MFKEYKIAQIGEVVGGGTPSTSNDEYWDGNIPWITPKDLTGYSSVYISRGESNISETGLNKSGTRLLPENTLLFSSRAPIGYVAIAQNPLCTNQGFKSIICNEKIVDPLYFYYYIKTNIDYFKHWGSGATFPEISGNAMRRIKVRIIEEVSLQKKIAAVLYSYDNLIEVNNKRIKVLEQMAENLYKEWFVRFRFPGHETAEFENGLPKGWAEMKLEQFGISLDSGSRPSGGVDDALTEGMPSLGAEAVNGLGEFDYSNVRLIPFEYYRKMTRGKNTGRDILVYKDGAYIGKTTIFMNGFPYESYAVNEHVFLLNALDADYQLYLYFTLHQAEYYALMQNLNRNAAQPGLSKQDMNRIKIVVPIRERVMAFNKIVEPILKQVFGLAIQKQNLIKQRDLLLPRLMSGKLEV